MSAIKDALEAIRDAVKLVDEVKRTAGKISDLAVEVRDIDRRVSRLEGKWEAAIDLGRLSANKPKALPKNRNDG
jgi:hypothetical protein